MKRIPSLDGFRCISVILVLFSHCALSSGFPYRYAHLASFGAVGLIFFFVISGFLITTLLLNEEVNNGKISVTNFYIRRVFRIVPILLLYVLFIWLWKNIEKPGVKYTDIIHALSFTINFSTTRVPWFFVHLWTLSVEEQFYISFPIIFILFRKHLKLMLFVLIAYSCITRAIVYEFPAYQTILMAQYFSVANTIMLGALGAVLLFENPQLLNLKLFRSYVLQITAASLIVLSLYFTSKKWIGVMMLPFGNLIISVAILFLIIVYIKPSDSLVYKFLNNKIVTHIGILSYSIYIWQQFFTWGSLQFIWRTFPYSLPCIYAVALASHYLWEQPFLKIRKAYFPAKGLPVGNNVPV